MSNARILGIVLIALGALLLLGWLHIPYLVFILGIVLIVVGVLMLMGSLRGAKWMAVLALVLGIIVVLRDAPGLKWIGDDVGNLLVTAVAIILIVLGVLKVMER